MIRSVEEALALLERHGVVTVVSAGKCPSLVNEIAGQPVRGSWWAHPKGKEIFAILTALDDHPDVLVTRLVEGKNALVHRRLWPGLLRAVTDDAWRTRALAALDREARALVQRVDREGRVRPDRAPRKVKEAVSRSLLVRADQEHTAGGRHALVLESWSSWSQPRGIPSESLSFDEAVDRLEEACGRDTLPFRSGG